MNLKAICALAALMAAVIGGSLWLHLGGVYGLRSTSTASSRDFPTSSTAIAPATFLEAILLSEALEQKKVKASFSGNGREHMLENLTNISNTALKVKVDIGQVFSAGKNIVITISENVAELAPDQTIQRSLETVAIRSTNKIAQNFYVLSLNKAPQLDALLDYKREHTDLSIPAIQTATLILMENLPLSAVSKFTSAIGEMKSRFNTDAFRVECADILSALIALREIGVADTSIAMTIDPQLKIEAMIDPFSRVYAMRYYGISPEKEWDFWRGELLNGAPATRHYALYGIARFYPEIALEMLPKWARESQTSAVYRLAAIQALADTQRIEALSILRQLSEDLGSETELGRAALGAAESLKQRLDQTRISQTAGESPVVNPSSSFLLGSGL